MVGLEPTVKIVVSSLLGTLADQVTSKIGLTYPELQETNPLYSPFNEFTFAAGGGVVIYGLGKLLRQTDDLSLVLALIPSAMTWGVAINNLAWIAWAHRKVYPWKECPILYPE